MSVLVPINNSGDANNSDANNGDANNGDANNSDANNNIDFTEQMLLKSGELLRENALLLKRIEELETRLKKYTNGENHKRYYEKNKTKIKEIGTAYLQKLRTENPDKLKEYSHNAYERKKLKKKQEEEEEKILQNMQ
jgi:hypothetical protein